MSAARVEVRRLDASRRADFWRVHCEANGEGWCCCTAWWVPTWEGWGNRSATENRALRESLFDRGEFDGYILYEDGTPVAWCQAGPRDRLGKLARQFGLAPDPGTWAMTCFVVPPPWRRKGYAARLLREATADMGARGARRVEAFPKRGEGLEPGALWNGPEAMFLAAGFRVVRDDPVRPVLALDL